MILCFLQQQRNLSEVRKMGAKGFTLQVSVPHWYCACIYTFIAKTIGKGISR